MTEPKHDPVPGTGPIGVEQLNRCGTDDEDDPRQNLVVQLVNLMGMTVAPMRQMASGAIDAELITAAIVFAGAVHGEIMAMGIADDLTPDALRVLLVDNWKSGVNAGKHKVERMQAEREAEAHAANGGKPS